MATRGVLFHKASSWPNPIFKDAHHYYPRLLVHPNVIQLAHVYSIFFDCTGIALHDPVLGYAEIYFIDRQLPVLRRLESSLCYSALDIHSSRLDCRKSSGP